MKKLLFAFIMLLVATSCKSKLEKLEEMKLSRYQQLDNYERGLAEAAHLVKLEQNKYTNELFKANYRKNIQRLFSTLMDEYKKVRNKAVTLRKIDKEDPESPYFGPENVISRPVQIGLAMENKSFKEAYLNSLKDEKVKIIGRVLDIDNKDGSEVIRLRLPIAEKATETGRLVLLYFKLKNTGKKDAVQMARKYQEVLAEVKVKKVELLESGPFVVIRVSGDLTGSKNISWMGVRSWKDDPSMLPIPIIKETKTKKIVRVSNSNSSSSKKTASAKKEEKPRTQPADTKDEEDEEDSDDFFGN